MHARRVEAIAVPAKGKTTLAPGGAHVMVLELTRAPKAGDRVPITVRLADGRVLKAEAEARARQ